ncbi:MAG: RNB domain-containing ribonuclease [Acidimicrobiia bacterium]
MIPRRRCVSIAEAKPFFDAIEASAAVPPFSTAVTKEVDEAIARAPHRSADHPTPWKDRTEVAFVTLDPQGSKDLDQAMAIERTPDGFRVMYAIADLGAFIVPGGALDAATRERGSTVYLPDRRLPLHPEALSEGAASLLPGEERPALIWDLCLDREGVVQSVALDRAMVRSRDAFAYADVQKKLDASHAPEVFVLLAEVGALRQRLERARGAINLALPDQELEKTADGWELEYRAPLSIEECNAQISLMVGMEAARILIGAGVGLLRVMPPPDSATVQWLRGIARVLEIDWPKGASYQEVVREQRGDTPSSAAFVTQAARLLRGAGYEAITEVGVGAVQSAVAAPYAHVTAPLRRLGDRFNNEMLLAITAGQTPPLWAVEALGTLPQDLTAAARRSSAVERAVVDLIEALLLERSVGARLTGWVVNASHDHSRVDVQIADPAIMTRLTAPGVALGESITVKVNASNPIQRTVDLSIVDEE